MAGPVGLAALGLVKLPPSFRPPLSLPPSSMAHAPGFSALSQNVKWTRTSARTQVANVANAGARLAWGRQGRRRPSETLRTHNRSMRNRSRRRVMLGIFPFLHASKEGCRQLVIPEIFAIDCNESCRKKRLFPFKKVVSPLPAAVISPL